MAYLWMLLSSATFATMGALAHELRHEAPWQVIALARCLVAVALMAPWIQAAGVRVHLWGPRHLWMRSIAGSLSMLSVFYGLTRLPVSITITLSHLHPIWITILSWLLLKELPGRGVWLAVFTGIAGVALVQQPEVAAGHYAAFIPLLGSLATAVAMIGLHRVRDIDMRAVIFHFALVSSLFMLAAVLAEPSTLLRIHWSPRTVTLLVTTGVVATLGQVFLTWAYAAGPPAKVAVVGLSQVVFALVYDVVLWNQSFNRVSLAGIALILAPTAWLLALQRRRRRVPEEVVAE